MARYPLSLYGACLHVAVTRKHWFELAETYGVIPDISMARGAAAAVRGAGHQYAINMVVFIDVKNHRNLARLVDTVAHEATHAAAQLFDEIEQQVDRHDSETLAYLVGWIAGHIWETTGK